MKKAILFIFIGLTISCSDNTGLISDMEYVIFSSVNYPKIENCKLTSLNHKDVKEIEPIIKKELGEILEFHEKRLKESYNDIEDDNFKKQLIFIRQYSACVNDYNEKIVTIRFMCNPNDKYDSFKNNWKTEPLGLILDGGSCYFNIIVDYTNKKVMKSTINSVA